MRTTKKSKRVSGKAAPRCSAYKHAAMKRDGWKNCWHCGAELNAKPNSERSGPKGPLARLVRDEDGKR